MVPAYSVCNYGGSKPRCVRSAYDRQEARTGGLRAIGRDAALVAGSQRPRGPQGSPCSRWVTAVGTGPWSPPTDLRGRGLTTAVGALTSSAASRSPQSPRCCSRTAPARPAVSARSLSESPSSRPVCPLCQQFERSRVEPSVPIATDPVDPGLACSDFLPRCAKTGVSAELARGPDGGLEQATHPVLLVCCHLQPPSRAVVFRASHDPQPFPSLWGCRAKEERGVRPSER